MASSELDNRQQSPEEMFKAEIQDFFDQNIYPGFRRPFKLKELRDDELARQVRDTHSFVVILEGVQEEDLPYNDREWTGKLWEIGQRWEMELRLPHWYFEK